MSQPTIEDYVAADRALFVQQVAAWLREALDEEGDAALQRL